MIQEFVRVRSRRRDRADAATLGSARSVSAFNAGTAVGTAIAGAALVSPLGTTGPGLVGTVIAELTLIPATALSLAGRRRPPAPEREPLVATRQVPTKA